MTPNPPMKYPKTPHLPFSPGVNSDDSTAPSLTNLLNNDIVITEKMDGGNFQYYKEELYARTVSKVATHASFSVVKQIFSWPKWIIPSQYAIYGENMTAIHSIEYSELSSYVFIFAIYDHDHWRWLSWDEVAKCCDEWGLPTVPVLYRGQFSSEKELQNWIQQRMKQGSTQGKEIEGFVVRNAGSFQYGEFEENVVKYVRKGHIQTGSDWSRTWKQAKVTYREEDTTE